jgi:diguanylate cyclase (GGDEF)-like protein/PAS domain S-box-containing protein
MRKAYLVYGSSSAVARTALLIAALLALAGSGLGVYAILLGVATGIERMLVLSGGLFASGVLVAPLIHRRVKVQTLSTASTIFYAVYLCAGIFISLLGTGDHQSLFVYLIWLFPLLVFNRLVNSYVVERFLAKVILIGPLVILGGLSFRLTALFATRSLYLVGVFCLSYACFGLMLTLVTRYRESCIVERERAESLRVEAEILESISDCFITLDSEFRLVYLNDAACSEFEVERRAALNVAIPNAVPGFFSAPMLAELRTASTQASASMFEAQDAKHGMWYEMRCFPQPGRVSICFRNITKSVLSRRKLEAALSRLRGQSELLDKAQDGIFVQDIDSHILYWNKGAERLFGWTAAEVMDRRVGDIFRQTSEDVKSALSSVLQHGEWTCELSKRHKDGRTLIVESRTTLLRNNEGNPRSILSINTDVTNRKSADARIHDLAFYDVLTGLPNRALLRERLEGRLATTLPHENMGALILIDLDDFKTLNDSSGHDIGNLLLQKVALRLRSCVRKCDFVTRFGGDEFVVMLEKLSGDAMLAAGEAKAVGEQILRGCRQPYLLGDHEYDGTASIGAALFRGNQDTEEDLLKRAELAMYTAKAEGRNRMCFFDPAMETFAASRAALVADLKRALQNRDFELYYQPQVDRYGHVTGAEALLRWRHAQRGMVPPSEFIPLAEATGLIVDLGLWVLETACSQIAVWARQPEMEALNIAVNVSARQFLDSHFVQLVEKVLRESGANPRRLMLEITESLMMEKGVETIAKMTTLKAHGVGFSMDDFGTGYSSLSQLKSIPLDQLKIDQTFIRDALNGVRDASIVRTIIALGRSLNLSVVAEGVEREEQREFLERQGCYAYQGYLFGPALPSSQFEAFVRRVCWLREKGSLRSVTGIDLRPLTAAPSIAPSSSS